MAASTDTQREAQKTLSKALAAARKKYSDKVTAAKTERDQAIAQAYHTFSEGTYREAKPLPPPPQPQPHARQDFNHMLESLGVQNWLKGS